jgi:hypothetical protein
MLQMFLRIRELETQVKDQDDMRENFAITNLYSERLQDEKEELTYQVERLSDLNLQLISKNKDLTLQIEKCV